jgi:glycerol-3-phosphate dehydrogenase
MIYHCLYKYYSEKNTYQFNAPRIVTKSEIKANYPLCDARYGVLYEDGLFNDSRMVSELLFTSTLKNYHVKANSCKDIPPT